MDMEKIRVRQDLERMVINYFLRGDISEEQSAQICDHIDNTIGGGFLPQPYQVKDCIVLPFPTSYTGPEIAVETVKETTKKAEEIKPPRKIANIISALPGENIPSEFKDLRPFLQRDGLILLSWARWEDKEDKENGLEIRVNWISSTGKLRKFCGHWTNVSTDENLSDVIPDRKGDPYYQEGRWFYGYYSDYYGDGYVADNVFLCAPELTALTRPHFINKLKETGINIDFDYIFNLTEEKKKQFYLENKEFIDLGFPPYIIQALNEWGKPVKELQDITIDDFRSLRGYGEGKISEVITYFKKAGITLQEKK